MMRKTGFVTHVVLVTTFLLLASSTAAQEPYLKPPREVLDVLSAPAPPTVWLSPTRDAFLLGETVRYPPLGDLAQPMLRLAGVRINPNINGEHRAPYWLGLSLQEIHGGSEVPIVLPSGARVGVPQWSADGKRFAFTNTTPTGIELWVGDAATAKAQKVEGVLVNATLDLGMQWMPDQRTLLVKLVSPERGPAPATPAAPEGPIVQEGSGKSGIGSTYENRDVLKNAYDEKLFDYYASSVPALVDVASGEVRPIGESNVYGALLPAPGGSHILVERIHRPYSYLHPYWRFAKEVEIWNASGDLVHTVASLPLADQVPIHGVTTGPRRYVWRPTDPATLAWVEALDGGDPQRKVSHRDRVMVSAAPFRDPPAELTKIKHRFENLLWGEEGGLAFLSEYDRERKWKRTFAINADLPAAPPRLLWDLSADDRYNDPGSPVMRILATGSWVIDQDGKSIYLSGAGAAPEGERPFLDRFDLSKLEAERLFRCDRESYEWFVAWIDSGARRFITRRESRREPQNYFLRTLSTKRRARVQAGEALLSSTLRPLTRFPDPTPELRGIKKQIVTYKRADGVPLSFTLYLPPGYKEGTRLPTVFWAYPLEHVDPSTAGQVAGSEQRFTTIIGASHLFFLLAGYAVVDNPAMPVIGHPDSAYDSFVEQIVADAKAAIDKAVELGVADPVRIGVGGHSHGGLMTANLLAHSDFFRAGIARSGAYNHTMRPFGFQSERRTLWEAPEVYIKLSPLMHATEINEPLLLIHGDADANPGTIPMQSERLYQAVRGTGGTVRLVMLPLESHGYAARESVEHTLYEMLNWFDRHVKNAQLAGAGLGDTE